MQETVREYFGLFERVRRNVINAADSATRSAGDLEYVGADGSLVLAVEVKERKIGNDDVHVAIAKAREFAVREVLFCCDGIIPAERNMVGSSFAAAWASGTNLYQVTIQELMTGVLPLTGEHGIKAFVDRIGRQLDEFGTQPRHRKAWKLLLDKL